MLMVDDAMVKALDGAAECLMQSKAKWFQLLAEAALAGCAHGIQVDEATRKAFATFHNLPEYTVKSKAIDAGPRMLATGLRRTDGAVSKQSVKISIDLRMCEHCCSVARKMGSCKQCKHATYCSAACQTAAWKAHKPACASLADPQLTTELGGDRDGRGTLLHAPLFLRETLRPDRPRLCKFWLEALVSCIETVAEADAYMPLAALLAYLWKYTWAAFPNFLRAPLSSALLVLHAKLAAEEGKDVGGMSTAERARARDIRNSLLMCDAVAWLAKGDGDLSEWLRGDGAGKLLPRSVHYRPFLAVDNGRTYRVLIAESLVRQHGINAPRQKEGLPPDTASVLQCIVPRGRGLVASAYGHAHALPTVKVLLEAWAAARDTAAGWRDMRDEVVHLYGIGAFDMPSVGPTAKRDPRYIAMPDDAGELAGRTTSDWHGVAEIMSAMQAAGARALPVLVVDAQLVEIREFAAIMGRLDTKAPKAEAESFKGRISAALRPLGALASGVDPKRVVNPNMIQVSDVELPAP